MDDFRSSDKVTLIAGKGTGAGPRIQGGARCAGRLATAVKSVIQAIGEPAADLAVEPLSRC